MYTPHNICSSMPGVRSTPKSRSSSTETSKAAAAAAAEQEAATRQQREEQQRRQSLPAKSQGVCHLPAAAAVAAVAAAAAIAAAAAAAAHCCCRCGVVWCTYTPLRATELAAAGLAASAAAENISGLHAFMRQCACRMQPLFISNADKKQKLCMQFIWGVRTPGWSGFLLQVETDSCQLRCVYTCACRSK